MIRYHSCYHSFCMGTFRIKQFAIRESRIVCCPIYVYKSP